MHKLLARQLKRIYGDNQPESAEIQELLRVVNETYIHNDNDRLLLERAISVSSDELSEANKKLRADAKNKRELLDKLLNAIALLARNDEELELIKELSRSESSFHLLELVEHLRVLAEEQKQAQAELRLQDARMNEAQTLANFGTWTYELETGLTEYSENLRRIFHTHALENLTKERYLSLVYKEDRHSVEQQLDQVLKRGFVSFTHRIVTNNGLVHWIEASVKSLKDESGKTTQLLGTALDITRLKMAESALEYKINELEETSDFLDTLIEQMPVSVYVKEADSRKYIKANRVGLEMMSLTAEQMLGHTSEEVFEERFAKIYRYQDEEVIRTRDIFVQDDEPYERADGQQFILRTHKVPIFDQNGNIKYILTISEDVTERKRVEEQIKRAAQTADEANRAKSAFLSNMSHELRTPLNAIIGFSQILQRDRALPEQQRSYIETMYRSGNHLLAMINDVLDISKIESGKFELVFETFSIKEIATDLEAMFTLKANEKGLILSISYDDVEHQTFYSDSKRIQQVLINLVGNAIKFTNRGSVNIHITTTPIAETSSYLIEFTISDTGRGIPENQLKSIFEPFRQVKGFYSDGTGLGLAISSKIVSMLSGELTVESQLGAGSTFTFRLPVEAVQEVSSEENDELLVVQGIEGDKKWRILIVDDITNNRMVVRAFLESLGFECIEADNGLDAVMMAELFHPDVIFMDIMMPGMNGIEAFKRIRNNPKSEQIAVIALTASGSVSTKKELMDLGFDDYITKPYRERWLIQSLEQVVGIRFIKGEITQKPLKETFNGYLTEAKNWFYLQTPELREPLMEAFELQSFEIIKRLLEPIAHTSSIQHYILQQAKQENYLFFISLAERISQV